MMACLVISGCADKQTYLLQPSCWLPQELSRCCLCLTPDVTCAARDMAAKLVGIAASALTAAAAQALLEDIVASFSAGDLKKHKFEEQDGAMAAAGYILAQSLTGKRRESLCCGMLRSRRHIEWEVPGVCCNVAAAGFRTGA